MTDWMKDNMSLTSAVSVTTIVGSLIGVGIYIASLSLTPGRNTVKITGNTLRIEKIENDIEQLKTLHWKVERIDERTIYIKDEIDKISNKLDN